MSEFSPYWKIFIWKNKLFQLVEIYRSKIFVTHIYLLRDILSEQFHSINLRCISYLSYLFELLIFVNSSDRNRIHKIIDLFEQTVFIVFSYNLQIYRIYAKSIKLTHINIYPKNVQTTTYLLVWFCKYSINISYHCKNGDML